MVLPTHLLTLLLLKLVFFKLVKALKTKKDEKYSVYQKRIPNSLCHKLW